MIQFTAAEDKLIHIGRIIKTYEVGKYLVRQVYPVVHPSQPTERFVFNTQIISITKV